MKKHQRLLLSLYIIVAVSCSTLIAQPTKTPTETEPPAPENTSTPNQTATRTPKPTKTLIPTYTATLTKAPTLIPTETLIPTITPTNEADLKYLMQTCVEVFDDVPEGVTFPGALVLSEGLLDLETFKLQPFSVEPYVSASLVSPDGSKLAVESAAAQNVQILNADGVIIKEYSVGELSPIYWLDNQTLVLQKSDLGRDDFGLPSYILDITTGSLIELDSAVDQIPYIIPDFLGGYWDYAYNTRTSINPPMTHLVFVSDNSELTLWNIVNDEEVARFTTFIGTSLPRWDSSGNEFLVSSEPDFPSTREITHYPYARSAGNDLFAVDIYGNIRRLSYISEVRPTYQHFYVWSPDNQKIAFQLEYDESEMFGFPLGPLPYAVLDVQTGQVFDLCIKGDVTPVWSPDGRYLAVGDFYESVYIVDLIEYKAYKVYDSDLVLLHGWAQ